jgi:hypothetical protein
LLRHSGLAAVAIALSPFTSAVPSGAQAAGLSPYSGSYELHSDEYGTQVTVTVAGGVRTIVANGLPNHPTGRFPNPGDPNRITAQTYDFALPTDPILLAEPVAYDVPQPYGLAINGVLIAPFADGWYRDDRASGWQLTALARPLGFDDNHAHVQPSGAYHYHGLPDVLLTTADRAELIGFAGDGVPIYGPYGHHDPADATSPVVELRPSYRVRVGARPDGPGGPYDGTYVQDFEYVAGLGDLDACNGRTGVTPESPDGTYHYVATRAWPYFGRCFAARLADSFRAGAWRR